MNSEYYRSIKTPVLEKMWERERDRLMKKKDAVVGDYDELFMMRREIERRKGDKLPSADVDFESYVTH